MKFPTLSESTRLSRLQPPAKRVRVVMDTDTYNEVDDQFAVVYALLSPERIQLEALYAAPFFNDRANNPADGMEKSYQELLHLLERVKIPDSQQSVSEKNVLRGSSHFLPGKDRPVESGAASDLVTRAIDQPEEGEPLYVVATGAITNVASAILLEPEIIRRIVVVWLGGNAYHWPEPEEFNYGQDLHASRLLFDCGVPLVHIPVRGVGSHLITTIPELERTVQGRGAIGDYLVEIVKAYHPDHLGWSKVIWDLAAAAYLVEPEWIPTRLVACPLVGAQGEWAFDENRHLIRSAYFVRRDPIFRDLFLKLERTQGTTES